MTEVRNELHERLRGLAENATPGPWHAEGTGGVRMDGTRGGYEVVTSTGRKVRVAYGNDPRTENADYIAAVSPDVLLALLAERDGLEVRLREAETALRYVASPTMGLPGGEDAESFALHGATEDNVRRALATCIRIARAASGLSEEEGNT